MAEKKIMCGGFLVGDGLDIDGKTLYATGGDVEPVDVTFENPVYVAGKVRYEVNGFVPDKPIRFWSGFYWGHIVLYPTIFTSEEGEKQYYYYFSDSNVSFFIYPHENKWLIQQQFAFTELMYNKDTDVLKIRDLLNSEDSYFTITERSTSIFTVFHNNCMITVTEKIGGVSYVYSLRLTQRGCCEGVVKIGSAINYVSVTAKTTGIVIEKTPLATT